MLNDEIEKNNQLKKNSKKKITKKNKDQIWWEKRIKKDEIIKQNQF